VGHERVRGQRQTCNHVRDEIAVAGRVQQVDGVPRGVEVGGGHVDGHPPRALLRALVQQPGPGKAGLAHLRRLLLVLVDHLLAHAPAGMSASMSFHRFGGERASVTGCGKIFRRCAAGKT